MSLCETLDRRIPPTNCAQQQTSFLCDLQSGIEVCLTGDVTENPYFMAGSRVGLNKLHKMRSRLSQLMLSDTAALTSVKDRHRLPHWNRLMGVWISLCSVQVLLFQIRPPVVAADPDDDLGYCELYLPPNRGGLRQILAYSMSELRLAIEVLCARVELLTRVTPVVHQYVALIELRCAQFVLGSGVTEEQYDVPDWRIEERPVASIKFVVESMWRMLAVKRLLDTFVIVSDVTFYEKAVAGRAEIVPLDSARGRVSPALLQTIVDFLYERSGHMTTDDHCRSLKKSIRKYDVSPGDCDVHTQLYTKHSVDPATPPQVIGRERSPTAVEYVRIDKYKRTPAEWITSLLERRELLGAGNHTRGSGCYSEAAHEQLTVVHVINMAFQSAMTLNWITWFIVSQRASQAKFIINIMKAIRTGLPFIVQRLGRFSCCVPNMPRDRDQLAIEQYINPELVVPENRPGRQARAVLYECHDIVEAFALWAAWTYYAHDGIIHSKCDTAPLLRKILALDANDQGDDATVTQQLLAADM